jgi:hypothetical protein
MIYYTQSNVMFWRWDGKAVQVLELGCWIKSLFSTPQDLKSRLDVEEIQESQLP